MEYADAVEEARKHPASAPKKTNATRNTTSNIDNAPGMSNTTAAELVATPLSYKAAQEQLALAESLEAVANATLLVGEAEGNVARKTHDVLASMKSVEESTADLARAENSADDGVGMALDVKRSRTIWAAARPCSSTTPASSCPEIFRCAW